MVVIAVVGICARRIVVVRASRGLNGCVVVREELLRKRVCGISERKNVKRRESAMSGSILVVVRKDRRSILLLLVGENALGFGVPQRRALFGRLYSRETTRLRSCEDRGSVVRAVARSL